MSQQKVLLTVCLVAGLIGVVYGQSGLSMNPAACGQSAQNILNQYVQNASSATQDTVQQIQQIGNGAIDVQGATADANNLMQAYSKLTGNPTQVYSLDDYMKIVNDIMTGQAKLAGRFLNPELGVKGFSVYMSIIRNFTMLGTSFMTQITQACVSPSTQ